MRMLFVLLNHTSSKNRRPPIPTSLSTTYSVSQKAFSAQKSKYPADDDAAEYICTNSFWTPCICNCMTRILDQNTFCLILLYGTTTGYGEVLGISPFC